MHHLAEQAIKGAEALGLTARVMGRYNNVVEVEGVIPGEHLSYNVRFTIDTHLEQDRIEARIYREDGEMSAIHHNDRARDEVLKLIEAGDAADVEQHLDQNQPEPKIEYQVWWHLNMDLMSEEMRPNFLDDDGNVPQFLAVSHLYTYGDAQKVMNDYQRRFPGNFYYVKEVAA